ncbi:pyridoxal phosphate-dependent aminotransferase [Campylobacter mucosalis]|uniref:pyridoxal phosphate-dependent aminotransferase n=1 Tax=Campylobacter mucosalis TaxID=202 RepID=UPI001470836C|nr:histidinol-phosphate transaminase [Campylobacter mucosalis]
MFENKNIAKLKPYKLASHKAWEFGCDNELLKLDWNEASILPSPKVKEELLKFIEKGHINWYPDTNNALLLKELSLYTNLPIDNIQYFAGSDSLHEYIAKVFVGDGDKITIVSPTYDNFRSSMESCGGVVDYFYLDSNFILNVDNFIKYLCEYKPKIVYICNPNNPTGTVYDISLIEKIISKFSSILFIIDEAYWEFNGITSKDLVLKYNNILICRTFSKVFALASFRMGYALSSVEVIKLLSKVRNSKGINMFSQIAAIAALQDKEYMLNYANEVVLAKKYFDNEIRLLGYEVFGNSGNFSLIKLKDITQKRECIKFLEQNKIFVRDYGHVANMENFIRITIGTTNQMQKVIEVIKIFHEK